VLCLSWGQGVVMLYGAWAAVEVSLTNFPIIHTVIATDLSNRSHTRGYRG
jgi:hypothetical protein